MRGFPVKTRLKSGLFLATMLTACLSLSACSDIDNMFGDEPSDMAQSDAPQPADQGARADDPAQHITVERDQRDPGQRLLHLVDLARRRRLGTEALIGIAIRIQRIAHDIQR